MLSVFEIHGQDLYSEDILPLFFGLFGILLQLNVASCIHVCVSIHQCIYICLPQSCNPRRISVKPTTPQTENSKFKSKARLKILQPLEENLEYPGKNFRTFFSSGVLEKGILSGLLLFSSVQELTKYLSAEIFAC